MAMYDASTIPVCLKCDNKDATKICKKCAVVYCVHFASKTDLRYCANCISDFHLKETIMEKVIEHERADGTITFSRKYQAKHIMLQGTDWLFQMALIPEMSDIEIDENVTYHQANISIMLQERESRKLERIRKLAGIKIAKSTNESQEQRDKRLARESKIRVKEKDLTPEAMMAAIAKAGLSPQQIMDALMGVKK